MFDITLKVLFLVVEGQRITQLGLDPSGIYSTINAATVAVLELVDDDRDIHTENVDKLTEA